MNQSETHILLLWLATNERYEETRGQHYLSLLGGTHHGVGGVATASLGQDRASSMLVLSSASKTGSYVQNRKDITAQHSAVQSNAAEHIETQPMTCARGHSKSKHWATQQANRIYRAVQSPS